ncbi:MetQ/NlpA family ABC transporter substrate-binding protein [Peptoniphilus sp. EMRHCC_23]|uniref:MetQ/NlpA family ABC transporter substrate-binding protein n=1 Tax=Peptoniphilus rachelemmaiella TaxID=2811779 RepID=UPI001C005A6E|nr:MetQ/NlpA family ABC transporter substrate-binding protein [Peptoniphilus rachelemmaiella]
MKHIFKSITAVLLCACLLFTATGCGKGGDGQAKQTVKLGVVGDDQRLWEKAAELAAKDGIKIELVHFSDYNTPNDALVNGDVDLNAFQHKAFLDAYNASKKTDLVPIGRTFISPIGAYSNKTKDLKDVPQGGKVSIPNDTTNGGRALFLLEAAGLIKLKDDVGVSPTKADIAENPKNITIDELDAAQVARTLPDVDAAVINTNLAIDAGLSPKDDAIFMEPVNENSAPYINYVVARGEDKDNELYKKVASYYRTPEVKELNDSLYEKTQLMAWELDIPDAGNTADPAYRPGK